MAKPSDYILWKNIIGQNPLFGQLSGRKHTIKNCSRHTGANGSHFSNISMDGFPHRNIVIGKAIHQIAHALFVAWWNHKITCSVGGSKYMSS